jgi:polyhydroxyalkanoate synthesis repressor PhaR
MGDERGRRLIKRYANRKLYDLAERRYVTLDELQSLVARGVDVAVEDQRTGEDVTSLTLAQILLEGQRQRTALIPKAILVQLVRLTAASPASATEAAPGAHRARDEAERIVRDLLGRGRLTLEEAMALRHEIVSSWSDLLSEAQAGLEAGLGRLLSGVGIRTQAGAQRREKKQGAKPKRRAVRPAESSREGRFGKTKETKKERNRDRNPAVGSGGARNRARGRAGARKRQR